MLLNLLPNGVKSPFYYIKRRSIKSQGVHLAAVYGMNARMTIKEAIDLFVADFAKLIDNGAG